MNNGLFGFPPGKNITVDIQEFETDAIWHKPKNAKFCFIEGTGGGQAGSSNGSSGCAGVAFQVIELASKFNEQELVDIGAGGTNATVAGGNTTFSDITWAGGFNFGAARNGYIGQHGTSGLGGGFGTGATNLGVSGRHGNFGGGGGGTGGANTGTDGSAGGKPRTFQFAGSSSVTAITGGGAAGGIAQLSTFGNDANPLNDRHGFGEGGGGGAGNAGGAGTRGGAGRRGSGGGGGGQGTGGAGQGGKGGDGFLRIQTYCWE